MLTISRALSMVPKRVHQLAVVHVVTDPARCMQCGICSFNCPAGIDVRSYSWLGLPVDDSSCLTCGTCVLNCPRQALQLEPINLTNAK